MPHPEPQQLERFMRGESPRDECRLIVRHLLAGCPECAIITRRIWALADRPLRRLPLSPVSVERKPRPVVWV
jgi:hypothetical protein